MSNNAQNQDSNKLSDKKKEGKKKTNVSNMETMKSNVSSTETPIDSSERNINKKNNNESSKLIVSNMEIINANDNMETLVYDKEKIMKTIVSFLETIPSSGIYDVDFVKVIILKMFYFIQKLEEDIPIESICLDIINYFQQISLLFSDTTYDKNLYYFLEKHKTGTLKMIQQELGYAKKTSLKYLRPLVKLGVIKEYKFNKKLMTEKTWSRQGNIGKMKVFAHHSVNVGVDEFGKLTSPKNIEHILEYYNYKTVEGTEEEIERIEKEEWRLAKKKEIKKIREAMNRISELKRTLEKIEQVSELSNKKDLEIITNLEMKELENLENLGYSFDGFDDKMNNKFQSLISLNREFKACELLIKDSIPREHQEEEESESE